MENESARADDLQINSATMPSSPERTFACLGSEERGFGNAHAKLLRYLFRDHQRATKRRATVGSFLRRRPALTTPRPGANKPTADKNRSLYWFTVVSDQSPVIGASPHSITLSSIPRR